MIKSLELKQDTKGLKSGLCMKGMNRVVVLTGINGVGKTRLLELLAKRITNTIGDDTLDISTSKQFKLYDLTRRNVKFNDPINFPTYHLKNAEAQLKNGQDINSIYNNGLLFIEYLKHSDYIRLERFNKILSDFLGVIFDRTAPSLKLFELEFSKAELSPGQEYILAACIAMFLHEETSKEDISQEPVYNIFILDEPELHLHPKVLIKFITQLNKSINNQYAQFWIATHSVALISCFDPDNVWYMSANKNSTEIKKMRSYSGIVSELLLGEYLKNIYNFLSTGSFAINQFAAQALFPQPPSDDNASRQLSFIAEKLEKSKPIKVLDWGAGKCRLWYALEECKKEQPKLKIEYSAYDPCYNQEEDSNNIRYVIYGNKIYNNLDELPEQSYDVVFLINTLHEIEPRNWQETFDSIKNHLSDDGLLIISEVEEFTIGELPNKGGYFVLSGEELKILLNDTGQIQTKVEKGFNNKVAVHIIPKNLLAGSINLDCAISKLKERASIKVRELRNPTEPKDYKTPLSYAFWSHQLVNILLWEESSNV